MRTYLQNGTVIDKPVLFEEAAEFYIQEINREYPNGCIYPGDQLKYELDTQLVSLYDKFRDLLFSDLDSYYTELRCMPRFVQEAGQKAV